LIYRGNYDLARRLIHKASEPIKFLAHVISAQILRLGLHRTHRKAESHFKVTIKGCNIQRLNLHFKAFSFRGLGEFAFACGDFALAQTQM
jgi:hypothetical protein